MAQLMPRRPVPTLAVPTTRGETWSVTARRPERFAMIVVYRGLHCPICRGYLKDLDNRLDAFTQRGVDVIAVSGDPADRADAAARDWGLERLTIGYGLGLDTARAWGLFVSAGIGRTSSGLEEPAHFPEPGLFLVKPDGTLYFASVQSMPFARPNVGEVLKAIDFVLERDYPARGEVAEAA
jgi:peroxiredoxin